MAGYRQFHNLTGPAFGKAVARQHLLVYPQLVELEDDLEELLIEGGIGLLTGEMGIGKTTALRHFLGGLEERACQVAYLRLSSTFQTKMSGPLECKVFDQRCGSVV